MRHEMFPGSARQKSEEELFQETIAQSEALIEQSDYGEIHNFKGLPHGVVCTKERLDNASDRYIFEGNGLRLELVHDRTNNAVIEPYVYPEIDPNDPKASFIKEAEDRELSLYKTALEARLEIA